MISFKRINGWSYKTSDQKFLVSNCGKKYWFSAEIDREESDKHGFDVVFENSKMYHSSLTDAQNWVRNYNYKGAQNV